MGPPEIKTHSRKSCMKLDYQQLDYQQEDAHQQANNISVFSELEHQ